MATSSSQQLTRYDFRRVQIEGLPTIGKRNLAAAVVKALNEAKLTTLLYENRHEDIMRRLRAAAPTGVGVRFAEAMTVQMHYAAQRYAQETVTQEEASIAVEVGSSESAYEVYASHYLVDDWRQAVVREAHQKVLIIGRSARPTDLLVYLFTSAVDSTREETSGFLGDPGAVMFLEDRKSLLKVVNERMSEEEEKFNIMDIGDLEAAYRRWIFMQRDVCRVVYLNTWNYGRAQPRWNDMADQVVRAFVALQDGLPE